MVTNFPALSDRSAQVLILGSMPGIVSLQASQYYALPRNSFWPIMASIYGFDAQADYEIKVQRVLVKHIAIWDVLQSCERLGSLDSAIVNGSRVANDFSLFFQQHPQIKYICFNGAEAEKSFNRFVLPHMDLPHFKLVRLPSTSPANTQSFAQKQATWAQVLTALD